MARITIEDCLRRIDNRFALVNMVAARVRELREGATPLIPERKNEDVVVALREIASGKIILSQPPELDRLPVSYDDYNLPNTTLKLTVSAKDQPQAELMLADDDLLREADEQVEQALEPDQE